ncbi:hypothetical protein BDZ88DRAFT_141692 [Geranomyces variabilis]|nr:hypothetical protein BDZ88DRAFT_141692 [Geranomyces variabilis]
MEDPFLITTSPHPARKPRNPTRSRTPLASRVEHGEVYPSFLQRVPFTSKQQHDADWVTGMLALGPSSLTSNAESPWTCRIPGTHHQLRIHEPVGPPLRLQQNIEVIESGKLFSRWEFLCHESSVRTLAAEAGWTETQQNAMEDTYTDKLPWFIGYVKRHIRACQSNSKKYSLDFDITGKDSAHLTFAEIVHDYRRVELLRIELSRSAWADIENAVCHDFEEMKAQRDILTFRWLKTIETISLRRPSLLSESLASSLLQPSAHRKLHKQRRPEHGQTEFGACTTAEIFNSKQLGVHVMSYPDSYIEPGQSSVGPYCSKHLAPAEQYCISLVKTPSAYKLMVGNPKLPFLHYTSEDVTEKHIEHLTRTFTDTVRAGNRPSKLTSGSFDIDSISSSSSSSELQGNSSNSNISNTSNNSHRSEPTHRKSRRRTRDICTTTSSPASQPAALLSPTVPSVIFDDFLAGCTSSPESYRAVLVVHTHAKCHPQHRAGLVLEYRNLPDQRWHPLIVIRLRRTKKDLIAQHMEEAMSGVMQEVEGLRVRLARVFEMLRRNDAKLLRAVQAELGKYEVGGGETAPRQSGRSKIIRGGRTKRPTLHWR